MSAVPDGADEAMRTLEGIRIHVSSQVERLTAESDLRSRLLQEEIDRRFSRIERLMDERRDNTRHEVDLIQEEIDRRLADMDKLNAQRLQDLKELMQAGQVSAREAVQAALASAEKAVIVAQEASERRLDSVNEFRETLSDQTATFVPRPESDAKLAALADRVATNADRMAALELRLTSRLDLGAGEDSGAQRRGTETRLGAGVVLQSLAVLISVAAIIVVLILHK